MNVENTTNNNITEMPYPRLVQELKCHDLRKNPDDLPEEMEDVIIYANDYGINTCYVAYRLYDKWWSNCSSERFIHVLAWCELPKFEE